MHGRTGKEQKSFLIRFIPKQLHLRTLLIVITLIGVGIAIRTQIPFYVDEIRGIRVLETKTDGEYRMIFETYATPETAKTVISFLDVGGSLFFFDGEYPKLSDPGAFVTIQKINQDQCIVKFANHGWSGRWFYVSVDQAVQYLWMCTPDNRTDADHQMLRHGMHFSNRKSKPPVSSKIKTNHDYSGYVFFMGRISQNN